MGILNASDLDFIEKFENCAFGKTCWTHSAHIRMAWIQLSRSKSFPEALERIRVGIQRFNSFVSSIGYHETVTVAFTRIIHSRMLAFEAEHTWTAFEEQNADLFSKTTPILNRYYTEAALIGDFSKEKFIEADKHPLPLLGNIRSACEDDATQMLAIYAPYIEETAVSFELKVPSKVEFRGRISEYLKFAPWLVFENEGRVVGYAYASKHRAREAYQWTVEVSAYVARDFHRHGIARILYNRLLNQLKSSGFYTALAGIALPNDASVGFHESLGFSYLGTYRNIGFKLNQWHDVGWWQKEIQPPTQNPRPLLSA